MNTIKSEKEISNISEKKNLKMNEYYPFRSAEAKKQYIAAKDEFVKLHWPGNSISKYVDTSFGKTFVRITGPSTAPPLVLLHGANGNSTNWHSSIKTLSEKFRTYAVDSIIDYGLSICTRPVRKPDDLVNWLDELFVGLDLRDNINLMGISYGGWETCQYALRFPNRLNKIVLLAPAATILPLNRQYIFRVLLMGFIPIRPLKEKIFSWMLEDWTKTDKSGFKEWVDEIVLSPKFFKKTLYPIWATVLTDEELQSIKVPTLFLVGENEKIYSAQKAIERLNSVATSIKKEIILNVGHALLHVQADIVNKKVIEFLEE